MVLLTYGLFTDGCPLADVLDRSFSSDEVLAPGLALGRRPTVTCLRSSGIAPFSWTPDSHDDIPGAVLKLS